mmetsp:Transcript_15403/g.41370  ORF Transcript_15403/g.41370 Transcript_15403/m.41370 type:complete len:217 (-) Transcript_15403:522-1172(-)
MSHVRVRSPQAPRNRVRVQGLLQRRGKNVAHVSLHQPRGHDRAPGVAKSRPGPAREARGGEGGWQSSASRLPGHNAIGRTGPARAGGEACGVGSEGEPLSGRGWRHGHHCSGHGTQRHAHRGEPGGSQGCCSRARAQVSPAHGEQGAQGGARGEWQDLCVAQRVRGPHGEARRKCARRERHAQGSLRHHGSYLRDHGSQGAPRQGYQGGWRGQGHG